MIWISILIYLTVTFFLNHTVAQVLRIYAQERPAREAGWILRSMQFIAVISRFPLQLIGLILYSLCCIGTIIADQTEHLPEHISTLWIMTLSDNLYFFSTSARAFLVNEFSFIARHARHNWSLPHRGFHNRGTGKLFSLSVETFDSYNFDFNLPNRKIVSIALACIFLIA